MARIDVSVCVATFRRPQGLARLVESLARTKLPDGLRTELIVVDNDAAQGPGIDAPKIPGWRVRALAEPRRNLAHARNAAVEAARGEWLAFVDDDEEVDERWLAAFWNAAQRGSSDAYFGPVLPRLEASGTRWLSPERFFSRPRHVTGAAIGAADARTGNAFLRRALLGEARFDAAFGETGGEDTELFRRLLGKGARFAWCDEARVVEWIPAQRHRLRWLVRRAFRGGCVHVKIARRFGEAPYRVFGVLRATAGALGFFAGAVLRWPIDREAAVPFLLRASVQAGQLWALLGGDYREYAA